MKTHQRVKGTKVERAHRPSAPKAAFTTPGVNTNKIKTALSSADEGMNLMVKALSAAHR